MIILELGASNPLLSPCLSTVTESDLLGVLSDLSSLEHVQDASDAFNKSKLMAVTREFSFFARQLANVHCLFNFPSKEP